MDSHEQRLGHHRRQPTLGKDMPVTALLLNLSLPSHGRSSAAAAAAQLDEEEPPPRYFDIAEQLQGPPSPNEERDCGELAGSTKPELPCLNCSQRAPLGLSGPGLAINEMCQRLCSDECRSGLSLTGSQATQEAQLQQQRRQDFLKQYEIAEALAKTSAMTSTTQMKQRLAARKLEMEIETAQPAWLTTPSGEAAAAVAAASTDAVAAAAAAGDTLPPSADYEQPLPRDLLLYLVRVEAYPAQLYLSHRQSHILFVFSIILRKILYRKPKELMGSFNSAPKINNVDSQDDGLEVPKGLSTAALLEHVQQLRGGGLEQPSLLSRCFVKPSLISEDVTDGLRRLKLNSVSRVCSAPVESAGSQNIRLLQWNILSQTLGQHNDGFVRCPEEALTWQHRKYLIVQEILQNQPDVVCLQEVDHFKFLQTVLGSQNYAGIFFPKPDSPCLYIEQNNGPDGCAIFYKRDKLQLLGYDTRILEVWRVQSNQVAIAARLQLKESGKEFCVCTTHLKARHGTLLAKLRNEQGRDLIRFVKQFAGESPLLLCGDFNAEPTEPIYATILGCDLFKLGSAYADLKLEWEGKPNTASEEDPNALIEESIKREPPYTTWKIREDGEECHTIDYVFYTPQQLKIKNCLGFPAGEQIGKNRTPSFEYPSDHFSLVCDFELLDEPREVEDQTQGTKAE